MIQDSNRLFWDPSDRHFQEIFSDGEPPGKILVKGASAFVFPGMRTDNASRIGNVFWNGHMTRLSTDAVILSPKGVRQCSHDHKYPLDVSLILLKALYCIWSLVKVLSTFTESSEDDCIDGFRTHQFLPSFYIYTYTHTMTWTVLYNQFEFRPTQWIEEVLSN